MKFVIFALMLLLCMYTVAADINFNAPLSNQDKQQFDAMLVPIMKIYNLLKYIASAIGVLMMVYSGITFVTAGGEMAKKEKAKNIGAGVVIGLIIIWVSPLIVQYIFS